MADQTIQYQTGFAPEIAPLAADVVAQTQSIMKNPYTSYQKWMQDQGLSGDQVAGFTGLQQNAFDQAGGLGSLGGSLAQQSGNLTSQLSQKAGNTQYDPNTRSFTQPGNASQYMSPYMDAVVEAQQRDAERQADIASTQRHGQATMQGAFGGSRQAVMDAEAQRNLALQKGDIRAAGLQNAFQQAQNQFNTENQLGEQSRQFGAGLGIQGLQLGLQGAGQGYNQGTGMINLQNQFGTQQQQQGQNQINANQQNYTNAMNQPFKTAGFASDIARGLPTGTQSATVYTPPPSTLSTVAGLGAVGKGFGLYARGGRVKAPAGLQALALHRMG